MRSLWQILKVINYLIEGSEVAIKSVTITSDI